MTQSDLKASIEATLPFALLLGIFLMGFVRLRPFIASIAWALVLSITLAPLHERIEAAAWGNRFVASSLMAVLMVIVMLLPMVGLSRAMLAFVPEALTWLERLSETALDERIAAPDGSSVLRGDLAAIWNAVVTDIAIIERHTGSDLRPVLLWLIDQSRILGTFVLEFALGIALATLIMGRKEPLQALAEQIMSRFGSGSRNPVAATTVASIRSTVWGILGAAAAQTLAAVVIYLVSGVPHWIVLTFLTFVLALVTVGPVIIWVPIALWLLLDGQVLVALFVVVWGTVVVGLADNVVRTIAVAKTSDLPASLAFLGAIGGLLTWGVLGVFLGPVIVALCRRLVLDWLVDGRQAPITAA